MGGLLCIFSPTKCATSLAKSTLNDVFNALTSWIVGSVQWLLDAAGHVLNTASEPSMVIAGANSEFNALLVSAPVLMMIGLLVSTLQALRHGDSPSLWRVYLGVAPACVAGIALARPMALLMLQAVDQMSSSASLLVSQREASLAHALLSLSPTTPGFGIFLLAVAVVIGTWLLWCELIVRTVVLTLLLVLAPVVVSLSTFPGMRRLSWRLAETFLAVALSKFIIVVTLVLGFNELQGPSATQVVSGAATLMLATFSPFLILKVIPFVEQSALHNLEGLRTRATRTAAGVTSSPVAGAIRSLTPDLEVPGPPQRQEDLGLATWPGESETPMPPQDVTSPPPPLGTPRLRAGHVAYRRDESGPVVGWHFDE